MVNGIGHILFLPFALAFIVILIIIVRRLEARFRLDGFLVSCIGRIFYLSHSYFTLLGLIERRHLRSKSFVEAYNIVWAVVLAILLFSILPFLSLLEWLVCILASLRLFDILVTVIRKTFLEPKVTQKNASRIFILTAINYIEIIVIFSILNYYPNFASSIESLQFSFKLFIPLISPDPNNTKIASGLFALEISISLIYHIAIIQRVVSYFK